MSRHSSRLNCEHSQIMLELPRLRLIYHSSVIAVIVTVGIAGDPASAVSEKEAAN